MTDKETLDRIRDILYHTPVNMHTHRPKTLSDALTAVEAILTQDYPRALREGREAKAEARRLTNEREVVRKFFKE